MDLTRRRLSFTFQLANGVFDEIGNDTSEASGYRASVTISHAGQLTAGRADVRIWGLSMSTMNRLTVTSAYDLPQLANNLVIISAGDENGGSAVCYIGNIMEAWVDGSGPPDMAFYLSANTAAYVGRKPVPPLSYNGSVDASILLAGIASQMDKAFENNGVTGVLVDPYKPGDLKSQLDSICRDLDCDYTVDEPGVLAVWPKGESKKGSPSIILSPETGMVGYPAFSQYGLRVRSIYNPNLAYGRKVEVQSAIGTAAGTWVIQNVTHSLDTETVGGQWFTDIDCATLSHTPPMLPAN